MEISIIVVNYNGLKHIKPLFDGFCDFGDLGFSWEIIFVDNNSQDNSINYLRENYFQRLSNIKIVQESKNLGFAEGNNEGVKHASGKYIVFLNNDTRVDKNWLIVLYQCMKDDENIGIATSKLVFFHDFLKLETKTRGTIEICPEVAVNGVSYTLQNKFCKNVVFETDKIICFGNSAIYIPIFNIEADFKLELKAFRPINNGEAILLAGIEFQENSGSLLIDKRKADEQKITLLQNAGSAMNERYFGYDIGFGEEDHGQYNHDRCIDYACGASLIMRKEEFIKVNGFGKAYFMYYEDSDLSSKIRRLGKKIYYCHESEVRHLHAASSGEWSDFFIYYITKNRLLFIYKNIGKSLFLFEFLRELKVALKIYISRKGNGSRTVRIKSLKTLIKQIRLDAKGDIYGSKQSGPNS